MSNTKLKEYIKAIRNCKTAKDERSVVTKESALIRNAFKVTNHKYFQINSITGVSKSNFRFPSRFNVSKALYFRRLITSAFRRKTQRTGIGILQSFYSQIC